MEYLKQIKKEVERKNKTKILNLWEEYCLGDEIDPSECRLILKTIKDSESPQLLGNNAEDILPLWEKTPFSPESEEIFALVFDLQARNEHSLGEIGLNYLKKHYGTDPHFDQKIRLVGLKNMKNFQGSIRSFLILSHMKSGNFFFHLGGWGIGEVIDFSFLREEVELEFENISGIKPLSFQNAFKILKIMSKDHFLSKRFGDPEAFEAFARKHPLETMRSLLRDLGPKTAHEIKNEINELVIPAEDWHKWWQTARAKAKKDTLIVTPSHINKPFYLRTKELTTTENLLTSLDKASSTKEKIEIFYSYSRDFPQTFKDETFLKEVKERLSNLLQNESKTGADEIQILFLLEGLNDTEAKRAIKAFITSNPNLREVVVNIGILSLKKRVLENICAIRTDYLDLFFSLLFSIDQSSLKDYILSQILADKSSLPKLKQEITTLIQFPQHSPRTFFWYFQKSISSELTHSDPRGLVELFQSHLTLLHSLEQDKKQRDFCRKLISFLTAKRFSLVRNILKDTSLAETKEILLLASKCHTLSSNEKKIMHSLAEVVHPELKTEEKEEEVIWSTKAGMEKIKEKIKHLSEVEMLKNTQEVEIARSYGDLRENSEYKFALEKRRHLQSELSSLSKQLSQMKVLTKDLVNTSYVDVGCKILLKDDDGTEATYTLLGPMEAIPEKNIISFQSKLAKNLAGNKVGDTIKIHEKSWTIVSIENALG